jgi:gliding motility-associated protein GldC
MPRNSDIKISIELNDKKLPQKISWEASDAGFEGSKPANTLMLSLWDQEEKVTLGIDLWTKEMLVDDMNIHFFQIFNKMADTYLKATNNNEVAKMIEDFSRNFADKLNLVKSIKKDQVQ